MPHGNNPAAVQAAAQARNGNFNLVELVENNVHVQGPGTPEQGALGTVRVEAQRLGVLVGGLNDDETRRRDNATWRPRTGSTTGLKETTGASATPAR